MNILEKACDTQVIIRGFRYPVGFLDLYYLVDKQFIRRPLEWEMGDFKARVPLIHRIRSKNKNKQNFSSVGTFSFGDDSFTR